MSDNNMTPIESAAWAKEWDATAKTIDANDVAAGGIDSADPPALEGARIFVRQWRDTLPPPHNLYASNRAIVFDWGGENNCWRLTVRGPGRGDLEMVYGGEVEISIPNALSRFPLRPAEPQPGAEDDPPRKTTTVVDGHMTVTTFHLTEEDREALTVRNAELPPERMSFKEFREAFHRLCPGAYDGVDAQEYVDRIRGRYRDEEPAEPQPDPNAIPAEVAEWVAASGAKRLGRGIELSMASGQWEAWLIDVARQYSSRGGYGPTPRDAMLAAWRAMQEGEGE